MFNTDPGAYSAAGYACTQVFLQALAKVGAGVTDLAALREAVRAYVATPSNTYDTALGTFSFDANGDTSQKIVSYYAVRRRPPRTGSSSSSATSRQNPLK